MAFQLPDLPYDYEALAPYMSAKTLHLHHDKHHQTYVTNLNNLIEGTDFAGKSLEEIVTGSYKTLRNLKDDARIKTEQKGKKS